MRKEYGKALKTLFSKRMKEAAPDFKEGKIKSDYLWPGEKAFCRKESDSIYCWIVLSPNPKGFDDFTIMVGWSIFGRYPELSPIPSMIAPTSDRKEFDQKEYLIRLPQLWTNHEDSWIVKEFEPALTIDQLQASFEPIPGVEAKETVIPFVEDAINSVLNIGIPYLTEFIETKAR